MPPQYRPAGQGLPKRRPIEDFTAHVMRVAKAKSDAPEVVMPLMKAMPKIPPRPPAPPRKIPKEPPYPPPGREIPQPMTPPKSPMTPPKPPCPRRKFSMAISGSASSGSEEMTTASDITATSEATKPPEPSTKPLITTATTLGERVQHPRLVRKPRTPPAPRRHMPSSAPPVVELPPAVEDMSGGECTEDNVNEGTQHAPLDALVERVVDEVSRRVLEHFASAPYMVGLSENAVCEYVKRQCSLHDNKHDGDEPKHVNSNQSEEPSSMRFARFSRNCADCLFLHFN